MTKSTILSFAFSFLFGSMIFANEVVPPPACPTITMTGGDVSCYGLTNGSATVNVIAGGSGSYTYTWATIPVPTITSGGLSSSLTNLSVGTYTVTVKDNISGCTVVGAFVVGSPDPIDISGIETDVNCYTQSTGSVDITVLGGSFPYSYYWSNGATTQDISGIQGGTYTVTVYASNAGCSATKAFTIDQPIEALNATAIVSNATCFNTFTGSIDLTVWGGSPPYAYSWDSGQSTQDISNIVAGDYDLTITDSRGCTLLLSYPITAPTQLTGSFSLIDPVDCFGEATGNLTYAAVGGTAPYTFSWQNSTTLFAEASASLNNIIGEDYEVTVTDDNGCILVDNAIVTSPTLLVGSAIGVNVSCYGLSDGSIDLTVSGGVAPYGFVWTNGVPVIVGSNEDLNGIPAENYTATITDFNNCELIVAHTITQPVSVVAATANVTHVLCNGDNTGAIDLTIQGGTSPYTFSWSSGQATEDIASLLAGSFTYNILDANNCPLSGTEVVNEPSFPLSISSAITHVICFGESNGVVDLTIAGGTSPYVFEWANSQFLLSNINEDLNNYPADSYSVIVTDDNGCYEVDTLIVTEPTELTADVTGVNILCHGGNNGSVDLTVGGGSIPYAFLWNTGAVTEGLNNLIASYYEVTVTDDHGCTVMDSITLTEPIDSLDFTYVVTDVLCKDGTDGEIDLDVTGGTLPYNYGWSSGDTLAQIENLTAGYYTFLLTDYNGCLLTDSIYVGEPDAVTLNEVITPVTCFGFSDGIIDISPVGGIAPYSFTWYNSQFALSAQTEDLIDYVADEYQLEIIDSNGCFYEMFLEIAEPELLVIEYTYNVVSCQGGSDGNILVDITGGNPAYTTTWSTGAITEDLLNIPSDTYQLLVVDTKGCTDSITTDIAQPDSILIDFDHDQVSCIDNYDGTAYAYPTGGNGGYFYDWSNGTTTFDNPDLSSQYYWVTVTDVLGCIGVDSVFITKDNIGCVVPVNAFSPNGDYYNDQWIIDNMDLYPDAEVQIFNKWGNLIHNQTGLYEPWDGRINDVEAPSEVYYWIINLNQVDREVLKGNITIIR
ncbi:MAG: gliding motility-associated C-terminal domain-containing protein [Crocinitomicaceae bacterium]|nr:gliding motility-associated C-terminal domain-containing protein [Crocinitomicaceae bacterium]